MYWWILAGAVALFVANAMWRAYRHPAHRLGRQAANLGWYYSRTISENGYRNTVVTKCGMEAVISYAAQKVFLLHSQHQRAFKDFSELEDWISRRESLTPSEDALQIEEENYHLTLDKMVTRCVRFLTDNSLYSANTTQHAPASFHAEVITYLAAFRALQLSGVSIHLVEWNSFKSSVENRMLAIQDDGSTRSGSHTEGGATTFVSYTSSYWDYLTQREKLGWTTSPEEQGLRISPVVDQLLSDLTASHRSAEVLQNFLADLASSASRDLIPQVARAFR